MLEKRADLNLKNKMSDKTALHNFIDNFEIVKLLIEYGAKINLAKALHTATIINEEKD